MIYQNSMEIPFKFWGNNIKMPLPWKFYPSASVFPSHRNSIQLLWTLHQLEMQSNFHINDIQISFNFPGNSIQLTREFHPWNNSSMEAHTWCNKNPPFENLRRSSILWKIDSLAYRPHQILWISNLKLKFD